MKRLPNVISVLRVAGSIGLLFCDVAGWMFWALYALCGISDMVDGWLARRLHAESNTGAILDSVSDILFVACCAIRLSPVLVIPTWLWIWAGIIAIIKIVNQISALIVYKRFCFPHTLANKQTGLLLFLTVPEMFWSYVCGRQCKAFVVEHSLRPTASVQCEGDKAVSCGRKDATRASFPPCWGYMAHQCRRSRHRRAHNC